MQIKYSRHIETRIAMRKIEYSLPKRIYENAEERFVDTETGHTIAVMKAGFFVLTTLFDNDSILKNI